MTVSTILNPAQLDHDFSLTIGCDNEAISSYVCGKTGSGVATLALRDILANVKNGSGVFVDLKNLVTANLLKELPELTNKQQKKIFHIDFTKGKKQNNLQYNPFAGKTEEQCIQIAQSIFKAMGNGVEESRIEYAKNLLAAVVVCHFRVKSTLSFGDILYYIKDGGVVDLYLRSQSHSDINTNARLKASISALGHYFSDQPSESTFNQKRFKEDLNGLTGVLSILALDFSALFNPPDSDFEVLIFSDAIKNGDCIIYDYGDDADFEIKKYLAAIMSCDLQQALVSMEKNSHKHFAFYTNHESLLNQATMLHILHTGKGENVSLVPFFQSYYEMLDKDVAFLYALSCTVKQQVFFNMDYPESEYRGLNPNQLKVCESLQEGNFLIIKQEHKFMIGSSKSPTLV